MENKAKKKAAKKPKNKSIAIKTTASFDELMKLAAINPIKNKK